MEKPRKPSFPPHRRLQSVDVKKSSSSLNMSTSSLRSINEDDGETAAVVQAGRRPAVVRFAPPTPTPSRPSSSAGTRRSSLAASGQAPKPMAPAPAATARPASSSGRKAAARSSPAESGPKGMRRSWGWTATAGEKERENGAPISSSRVEGTATQARSSSVPRRMLAEEKPLQKRESRTNIISRTKAKPSASPKPDVLHKSGAQRNLNIAGKNSVKVLPSCVSPDNLVKVSTSTTKGASWESLPSALQTLGSGVMSYRDAVEMAAVEAMQEASAAEIVLRCLSAFADLAASAAKQSPQDTVDEFFALQAAITRSTAALDSQQKRNGHAGEWLHAAVTSNLAPFLLYAAASSSRKQGTGSPRTVAAAEEETVMWLETAARELREEMCAWFVGHVERLLDDNVAGTLGQLKRVNDWLDDGVGLRPGEALERLRKKIFGYLLDHVESAVVALNGGVASNRNRRK
ncbi:uncharacterized protein [Lolium perenne]|uniref:uncharacterized protein n=1 Tax=Lolium perenne TaxID=4522 RepID=UPI0021F60FB2|nr:uncharacterized protein LOC127348634 [Lolium perenne]